MSSRPKSHKKAELELSPRIKFLQMLYDEIDHDYIRSAHDDKEIELYEAAKGKPDYHQKIVNNIYRIKLVRPDQFYNNTYVDGKPSVTEVLIYYLSESAVKWNGQPVSIENVIGGFEKPLAPPTLNPATGKPQVQQQVTKYTPLFTIPFSPDEVDNIIAQSANQVDNLYVAAASATGKDFVAGTYYRVKNLQDFKQGTWQELMEMGVYNYHSADPRLQQWREDGPNIKRSSQLFQTTTTINNPRIK